MVNLAFTLFNFVLEYMWIDCDYLLGIMKTSTEISPTSGIKDKIGHSHRRWSQILNIDPESKSENMKEEGTDNAHDAEYIKIQERTEDSGPIFYNDSKTVRQLKLRENELSSTSRIKNNNNSESSACNIKQTARM